MSLVVRDGRALPVGGDTRLEAGDEALVLGHTDTPPPRVEQLLPNPRFRPLRREPSPWAEGAVQLDPLPAGTVDRVRYDMRCESHAPAPGPLWRWVSGAAAVVTIAVAVAGPVGTYAEVLFWVHMVQHLLLIMVAPVLLIWARPLSLIRFPSLLTSTFPALDAFRRGGPVVGLVTYTAVVVLTHLTGFQQVSATHPWVRAAELLLYLVAGMAFLRPLVGSQPGLAYLLRLGLLAVGMGADTLTGVALMLTSRPLAPIYASTHPGWGPDALHDQQVAGAIMWFGGDLLMMLLMILVGVRWSRAEPDQQGLGEWLESARRRALMGDDDLPTDVDVDVDQRALDAYNATLAALHGRPAPSAGGPTTGSPRDGPRQR